MFIAKRDSLSIGEFEIRLDYILNGVTACTGLTFLIRLTGVVCKLEPIYGLAERRLSPKPSSEGSVKEHVHSQAQEPKDSTPSNPVGLHFKWRDSSRPGYILKWLNRGINRPRG
jgi:hypothetical protein